MNQKATNRIKLTFLGTGTSQGVPVITCPCDVCHSSDEKDKRMRSSVLIQIADINLVIDTGPDFRQQMLKNNITSLQAVILTHEHVDHLFGLDDIRPFNWVHKKPMDIYAEKRVETAIKRIFDYVFANDRYPGIPQMNLCEVKNEPFYIHNIKIIPIRGYHHKLPVFGYRIGNVAYITDVNLIPEEEQKKLEGLDVLIINALHHKKHISHFNLEQALALSEKLAPKKTYFTHISHTMGKHAEIQKQLPNTIFLACDNLQITVPF